MHLCQEYHKSDSVILYAPKCRTVSVCPNNDDVHFDHSIKTVYDGSSTLFLPFLTNILCVGGDVLNILFLIKLYIYLFIYL